VLAPVPPSQTVVLRLPFRAPLCPDNLFGHLAATAVPGVEEIRDGCYRRTLRLPHGPGIVGLVPAEDHIRAVVTLADLRDLGTAITGAGGSSTWTPIPRPSVRCSAPSPHWPT